MPKVNCEQMKQKAISILKNHGIDDAVEEIENLECGSGKRVRAPSLYNSFVSVCRKEHKKTMKECASLWTNKNKGKKQDEWVFS